MSHDDAFLQAIIAAPDDDAPRLIYADWLDERGDPRGEFIRVQCALARMDEYDPRRWDLEAREKELLITYETQWLGPLEGVRFRKFIRGLLEQVSFSTGTEFLTDADALSRHGVVRDLSFGGAPTLGAAIEAHLPDLLRHPLLEGVESLGLADCLWDHDGVRTLASSERLKRIRALVLRRTLGPPLGPEGLKTLSAARWFGRLRRLDLRDAGIGAAGCETLASCTALADLRELRLSGDRLGESGLQMLSQSRTLANLSRLHLWHNDITPAGIAALASSPHFPDLEELSVGDNPIGNDGFARLIQSPHRCALQRLNVADAGITGSARMDRVPEVSLGWTKLNLSGNRLGPTGASWLANRVRLDRLTHLDLSGNEIGDAGAKALAASPNLAGLQLLCLAANGLSVWGVKALTQSPHLKQLRHLDLHGNKLGDAGLQVLARWPSLNQLLILNVRNNRIGDLGVNDLCGSPHVENLRQLDVSDNELADAALGALETALTARRLVSMKYQGEVWIV